MFFSFAFSSYIEPTEQMKAVGHLVRVALEQHHIAPKEAAEMMRLDHSELLKQLACVQGKHLSAYRLVLLPREVQRTFLMLYAQQLGMTVLDPSEIAGACELMVRLFGRRRMVRAELRQHTQQRRTA